MDFTQIQVGLDIATAASIIGASIAFIYSNLRESRKLRNERRNILAMEKTADLVMFLSDKSVEAASINNEINCTLNEYNDALLIHLAKRTDVLTYVPEEVSIRPLISKLEENIFIPIKLKLDLYPYRKFLSNEIEKDIDKLLEFIVARLGWVKTLAFRRRLQHAMLGQW